MEKKPALTINMTDDDKTKLRSYQKEFEKRLGGKISQSSVALLALRFFLDKEHEWPKGNK